MSKLRSKYINSSKLNREAINYEIQRTRINEIRHRSSALIGEVWSCYVEFKAWSLFDQVGNHRMRRYAVIAERFESNELFSDFSELFFMQINILLKHSSLWLSGLPAQLIARTLSALLAETSRAFLAWRTVLGSQLALASLESLAAAESLASSASGT